LLPGAQGRGLGTRAVAEVLTYAFREVGAEYVFADPREGNAASRRIFDKNGLQRVDPDQAGNYALPNGGWYCGWERPFADTLLYVIWRSDWLRRQDV
jgi:RimJ/RimL family protein N-acetyltransferase